jgi:nitrogen-specific signal transduction histidine kinase
MGKNTIAGQTLNPIDADFFDRLWEESWTYIKTVVDVVREPVLILDKDLRVMAANESFYHTFQVEAKDTEHKIVYELGNGQWNIPALKKLLEDILPKNAFFKGFEVAHDFPAIGRKVMILNARQIHISADGAPSHLPPIIMLAIEDVTEMMAVAETLASHTNQLEAKLTERTQKLETNIERLEKEIGALKKASV